MRGTALGSHLHCAHRWRSCPIIQLTPKEPKAGRGETAAWPCGHLLADGDGIVTWPDFRQFMLDQRRQLADNALRPMSGAGARPSSTFRASPTLLRRRTGSAVPQDDPLYQPTPWASLLLSSFVREKLHISGAVQKLSGMQHTWRSGSWQARFLELDRKKGCLTYLAKKSDAEANKGKRTEIPLAHYRAAVVAGDYKRGA